MWHRHTGSLTAGLRWHLNSSRFQSSAWDLHLELVFPLQVNLTSRCKRLHPDITSAKCAIRNPLMTRPMWRTFRDALVCKYMFNVCNGGGLFVGLSKVHQFSAFTGGFIVVSANLFARPCLRSRVESAAAPPCRQRAVCSSQRILQEDLTSGGSAQAAAESGEQV